MNFVSRTITGTIMVVGGLFLIALPLFVSFKEGGFVAWIYGIPVFILGLFILFNKKEDDIETIKTKTKLKIKTKSKGGKK